GVAIAGALFVAALAAPAVRAQTYNPYFQIRPGLTVQQYAYNIATVGRALQQVPPYAFRGYGYNPYYNPYLQTAAAYAPYANLYSASLYSANPYAATAAMTTNPYGSTYAPYGSGAYSSSPYYPYSYETYPFGGYLRGGADVIDSQGRFLVSLQQRNL